MLLNFQRGFAQRVWAGEKRQTIRSAGARKHVPKVGETAYCYTGLRTRNTVKLGAWPICRLDVIRFEISPSFGMGIPVVGNSVLTRAEWDALAMADGFASSQTMSRWFEQNHPPGDFYGWVVGWEWSPVPSIVLPFAVPGTVL